MRLRANRIRYKRLMIQQKKTGCKIWLEFVVNIQIEMTNLRRSKEEIISSQNTFKECFNKPADIGNFFKILIFIGCRLFFIGNESWQC